jgi:hypothetical protein
MKTKYTVTPFHPCNDADRAEGTVAGWDVRDENHVTVECFDTREEADARCAELNSNSEPVGTMPPAEEMTSHFVPAHFFDKGKYEVWAKKCNDYNAPLCLIAGDLSLKTARFYNWPDKQIRHKDWPGYRLLLTGEEFGQEGDEYMNKKWHRFDPQMQKKHIVEAWEQSMYRRPIK